MEAIHSDLTRRIIGSALEVHRALGPGLLERTYRACLMRELSLEGLEVRDEVPVPVRYRGVEIDSAFRADMNFNVIRLQNGIRRFANTRPGTPVHV